MTGRGCVHVHSPHVVIRFPALIRLADVRPIRKVDHAAANIRTGHAGAYGADVAGACLRVAFVAAPCVRGRKLGSSCARVGVAALRASCPRPAILRDPPFASRVDVVTHDRLQGAGVDVVQPPAVIHICGMACTHGATGAERTDGYAFPCTCTCAGTSDFVWRVYRATPRSAQTPSHVTSGATHTPHHSEGIRLWWPSTPICARPTPPMALRSRPTRSCGWRSL